MRQVPDMAGIELAEGYESLSPDDYFEDQVLSTMRYICSSAIVSPSQQEQQSCTLIRTIITSVQ